MKKKLLITLGCSLTEGVGCYDYTQELYEIDKLDGFPTEYQINRFHEFGWPNRLGKKLNYDKVINLGWGGSSNSAHIKLFVEKILIQDFSDYDILVIWMLTSTDRFSFYVNGRIGQFFGVIDDTSSKLERGYFETIRMLDRNLPVSDDLLETVFYIKCLEQMCENNSFNLLITSWENLSFTKIRQFYKSKYYMKEVDSTIAFLPEEDGEYCSKVCRHPNEMGYEVFANNMFNSISKFNPHLINTNKVDKFTWEWDGNPKVWDNII